MAAAGYGALLDALRGVSWPARRPSRGATSGTHVSRLRGASAEFTEYRAYRQGDDPRRLDWKLLARTDRAFLRITNERATMPTLFVLDASASLAFPADTQGKWAQACRVVVGLAAVAHAAADPVGIVVPGTPRRALPMRARGGVVSEIARLVDGVTPGGEAPLAPVVREAARAARLVLVTDLLGDAPALLRAAREQWTRGVDLVLVHVVARAELDPPVSAALAEDPERPEVRRALVGATRDGYLQAFAAWRAEQARTWALSGARYVEVVDDEPADRAVRRVVGAARDEGQS
ncbi:MAG: DUF58 domain-containing protein [Gemmatimonadetes bacterium]|nr:DUF58 domain-containing protein [Gemmatimonadota bacterium]